MAVDASGRDTVLESALRKLVNDNPVGVAAVPLNSTASGGVEEVRLGVTGTIHSKILTMTAGAWTVSTNDADHAIDLGSAVGKAVRMFNPGSNAAYGVTSVNAIDATEYTAMDTQLGNLAGGTEATGAFYIPAGGYSNNGEWLAADPATLFTAFACEGTNADVIVFEWLED